MMSGWCLLLVAALADAAEHLQQAAVGRANPIRKVVNMLQDMEKKVTKDGEEEEQMYKKYMCYCRTNGEELKASIGAAASKGPLLNNSIEEAVEKKTRLDAEVETAKAERASAKSSMDEATAIREKEAAAFAKESSAISSDIAAIRKAVEALEAGVDASFLQSNAAGRVRKLLLKAPAVDAEYSGLFSFLSGGHGDGYAPQSGEIIGILKQLEEQMSGDSAEAATTEKKAIAEYEAVMAAKKKEVAALTAAIERKMTTSAELGVEVANMNADLDDTQASLMEDQQFLEDLGETCANKSAEWDVIVKTRQEELIALAETINILNDDSALDIFKKTLPSAAASLIQISGANTVKTKALEIIGAAARQSQNNAVRLDFVSHALRGKTGNFSNVMQMIDEMVETLNNEQDADDDKKQYCRDEMDKTEDKKKSLSASVSDLEEDIATTETSIDSVTEEIQSLKDGVNELDKSVADATEQRKGEAQVFAQSMQDNKAAKELLIMAVNRLHEFYNAKLHTTTILPMSRDDQIVAAFEGPDFVQLGMVARHSQAKDAAAPPPPPESPGPYSKKMEENTGVLTMINLLVKDLDTEMTEALANEKNAQTAYEKLMQDSAEKRATDSKALTEKIAQKSGLEEDLQEQKDSKVSEAKELGATEKYLLELTAECEWLLMHFDTRKQARASEIASLGDAKAVLSGADYSLLQVRSRGNLRASREVNAR